MERKLWKEQSEINASPRFLNKVFEDVTNGLEQTSEQSELRGRKLGTCWPKPGANKTR